MIGDTNLFFCHSEDCAHLAEAEIMIAEKNSRQKRLGWEAMLLMLRYGMFFYVTVSLFYTCEYITKDIPITGHRSL
jgi:hypothetical protein